MRTSKGTIGVSKAAGFKKGNGKSLARKKNIKPKVVGNVNSLTGSKKVGKDRKSQKSSSITPVAKTVVWKSKKEVASGLCGTSITDYLANPGWVELLQEEMKDSYFQNIISFLENEIKQGKEVYPPKHQIFAALNLTPPTEIKVVILGQDPYHDTGQAHGLSFSVPQGIPPPPSLRNIYKELTNDVPKFKTPAHGDLTKWAQRGVLLLNATLTVEAHQPNSHAKCGWQRFTDAVIRMVNEQCNGVVFILWGGFAHKKAKLVDGSRHAVIQTAHPSPLSVSKFMGCACFSKANNLLVTRFKKKPIDWNL